MRKAPITTPRVTNALCSWERIPLDIFTSNLPTFRHDEFIRLLSFITAGTRWVWGLTTSLTFKNAHPRGDKKRTSGAHPRVHDDRAKAHPIAHTSSATLRLAPTPLARVLFSLSLQSLARVHLLPPQLLRLVHCRRFSLQAGAGLRWKYVFINLSTNSHLKCPFVGASCTLVVIDIAFFCFTASLESKMWWNKKHLFSNL